MGEKIHHNTTSDQSHNTRARKGCVGRVHCPKVRLASLLTSLATVFTHSRCGSNEGRHADKAWRSDGFYWCSGGSKLVEQLSMLGQDRVRNNARQCTEDAPCVCGDRFGHPLSQGGCWTDKHIARAL
eukprot:2051665-Amphidinium_carterae.1